MISSLHVAGYRGFETFDMAGLGRVNLLVGTNSSGKTSILEALYLLATGGDPATLQNVQWRRGERSAPEPDLRRPQSTELDVSHLFTGHKARAGAAFTISGRNRAPEDLVRVSVAELSPKEQAELFPRQDAESRSRLALRIHVEVQSRVADDVLPLTPTGGIRLDLFRDRAAGIMPAQLITTESVESEELVALWDKVALTPSEEMVLRALRFVDPDIERLAAQAGRFPHSPSSRGGFIVKTRRHDVPVPIGSMGDGIWRMLAMAIAITQSAGGFLLVDEIDTGLHYTVMSDMWRLIFRSARELDVQVFATSHSLDCVQSLASVCVAETDADNQVTLQRIESGSARAVPYTEHEIRQAAERNIEVR